MKYRFLFVLIICLLLSMLSVHAFGKNENNMPEHIIDSLVKNTNNEVLNNVNQSYEKIDSQVLNKDLINTKNILKKMISGESNEVFKSIYEETIVQALNELKSISYVLSVLIAICIIKSILDNISPNLFNENTKKITGICCNAAAAGQMAYFFGQAVVYSENIITNAKEIANFAIPSMIIMLITCGFVTSAGMLDMVLVFLLQMVCFVIKNIALPLITFSAAICAANCIIGTNKIKQLGELLRKISIWITGAAVTIFFTILSMQGTISLAMDGVVQKAAKFSLSTFVPIAGEALSDAADTVFGCALFIKNATGIAVLVGGIIICAIPLIKIAMIMLVFSITGAVIEPIDDSLLSKHVLEFSQCLKVLLGMSFSIIFILTASIAIIIRMGGTGG